jgi:hypothetical protein
MPVSKVPLPSAGRIERYVAYGALGAAALGLVLLIAFLVYRRRSPRPPIPIPEYAIVHTPGGRVRNMAWAVATTVVCILVKRALDVAQQEDGVVRLIGAVIEALLRPGGAS